MEGVQRNISSGNTSATITSQTILNTLANYGINSSHVIPAFPEFNESDTVNYEIGEDSRQMNRGKVFVVRTTNINVRNSLINDLSALTEVLFAEANGLFSVDLLPNDTRFNEQWGLRNSNRPGADIHAERAWDIFTGNPNSIIAIIDQGVDINHNDLNTKIVGGDNTFQTGGHGTQMAGIAAAISNNNLGISGVDWKARIYPRNALRPPGDPILNRSIIEAVNFNPFVWTLNNSYSSSRYSTLLRQAFAFAYRNNRVSCASMGNHQVQRPNAVHFPVGFNTGLIAVGATDQNDGVIPISVQGPHIDVSAPGIDIISPNFNNGYIAALGTSHATAHVSGLASLVKGFNPNLANDDVEQIIRLTADDVNGGGFDNAFGTGRINAERALQSLQAPNQLFQWNAVGGQIVNSSNQERKRFLGTPRLRDGTYITKRHEVRRTVTFPNGMCNMTGAWGRGVGTTGFREERGICYGEGICEIIPGTLTNTGAILRTWVYEVWNIYGQYFGFYPQAPQNVTFQYSVLGVPTVTAINGSDIVCNSENYILNSAVPAGSVVSWTPTPSGLVNISPNTPNWSSVKVEKISSGDVTLTASVPGCSAAVTVSRTIRVGASWPDMNIYGPTFISCGQIVTYYVSAVPGAGYQWSYPSSWIYNYGLGTNSITLQIPDYAYSSTSGEVRLLAYDACNNSILSTLYVSSSCGEYYYYYSLSPNPASSTVTVSTKETTPKGEKVNKSITEVNIYDQLGNIQKRQKFGKVKTATLNVSELKTGVYFVEIVDGTYKERQQLSIQR